MLSALGVRHMNSQAPSKSHSAQDWGWGSLEKVGMRLQWSPEVQNQSRESLVWGTKPWEEISISRECNYLSRKWAAIYLLQGCTVFDY